MGHFWPVLFHNGSSTSSAVYRTCSAATVMMKSPARQPVEGSKRLRWSSDTLRASCFVAEESQVSVAQRVDGDHFELPADAVELLRQVRPGDRQRFIEEVTEALAVAADTKDFAQLQRVLAAWAATIRLQRRPGYEATIRRMQRRERGVPVDLDELRHPRG